MNLSLCLVICISVIFGYSAQNLENLALHKPAYISSQHADNDPENANDGNIITNMQTGTCTHSLLDNNPWWTVDLGQVFTVEKGRIYNRDGYTERLVGFRVYLSDVVTDDPLSRYGELCYESHEQSLPLVIDFNCQRLVRGRYLTVTVPRDEYLTLCEVQVFEKNPEQVTELGTSLTTTFEMTTLDAMPTVPLSGDKTSVSQPIINETPHQESTALLKGRPVDELDSTSFSLMYDLTTLNASTALSTTEQYVDTNESCQCLQAYCSLLIPIIVSKEAFLASIMENLQMDQKNVSRERNRFVSVPDERPSAQTIGSAGLVFIVLVFGSIVLLDAISLVRYLATKKCFKCQTLSKTSKA